MYLCNISKPILQLVNLTGATFDSTEPDSEVDLVSHALMLVQWCFLLAALLQTND
jgi:hypothetical protein